MKMRVTHIAECASGSSWASRRGLKIAVAIIRRAKTLLRDGWGDISRGACDDLRFFVGHCCDRQHRWHGTFVLK